MLKPSYPRQRLGADDGIALPVVLLSMLVLTAFALAALAFVVQSTQPNRTTADSKGALAAAQAGVDEYTSRLNGKPTYYTAVEEANPAFTLKADGTPYFSDGRDLRGAAVPGTTDSFFRYVVLTKPATTAKDGIIRVRVTGTASGQTKSLTASYGVEGYLKYLYFTDIETIDPALLAKDKDPSIRDAYVYQCSKYWYAKGGIAGRAVESFTYNGLSYDKSTVSCADIQFSAADVIEGPLHSNDALFMGGNATFKNRIVETGWGPGNSPAASATKPWRGTGTPQVNKPESKDYIPIPSSNAKVEAQSLIAGVGCQYTGETSLIFTGTSVKVLSPNTTSSTPGCFDANRRDQEQTWPTPSVMFVVNGTSCSTTRVTYLQADKAPASLGGTTTVDDCKAGNAFVSGTISGQATVGAENDVIVTGNLKYAGNLTGDDVLGLVPNNYVWVYHPIAADGSEVVPAANRVTRIDAAIFSVQRSFLVQNWNLGSRSSPKLTVNGVIAQKFRGPVGTSNGTGYTKNYVYDGRLKNLPPPYFIVPDNAPWVVQRITDG